MPCPNQLLSRVHSHGTHGWTPFPVYCSSSSSTHIYTQRHIVLAAKGRQNRLHCDEIVTVAKSSDRMLGKIHS